MTNKKNRVHYRIRSRNAESRPILSVYKTENHIYAQIIHNNRTIVALSTVGTKLKGYNQEGARQIGEMIGIAAKKAGISTVVFDRGSSVYTGRIAALADGARKELKI